MFLILVHPGMLGRRCRQQRGSDQGVDGLEPLPVTPPRQGGRPSFWEDRATRCSTGKFPAAGRRPS